MDDRADLADALFEHAVRRRIGDHERREHVAEFDGASLEIVDIDVARVVTLDDYHSHTRHRGRRGVGAMRRRWNQTDIAMGIAA